MQSYVAPAVGAPRGVRKRGLSKGTGACVRGGVKSWVAMARTRRQGGRGGRFWRSFLATFARHWYTGVRVLDAILERFLSTQKHRSRWSLAELCSTRGGRPARGSEAGFEQGHRGVRSRRGEKLGRNGPDAAKRRSGWSILARIFGHLCTALVYREAFFGRNFGAPRRLFCHVENAT